MPCVQRPLAFGNFPLPLCSKLNSCRLQKPGRGKNQVRGGYFVTYGFRNALVLPFTFFSENKYGLLYAETVTIPFMYDLTGHPWPESPLACPCSLPRVMLVAPVHGTMGTCCWDELPTLVLPFAHPTAFLGACSFSKTGIKVYPRKLAGLTRQKVPFL